MSADIVTLGRRKVQTLRRILRSFSPRKEWDYLHAEGESKRYESLEQLPRYWMIRGFCEWAGSNLDVLEIGCGVALLPPMFRDGFFSSYTGLDVSPVALQQAANRFPQGRYVLGKAEDTRFADESFDLLIFNETLYYLRDFPEVLFRYFSYLRPSGHVVLSITHIEATALELLESRFGVAVRKKEIIIDPRADKSWSIFLLCRPGGHVST